MRVWNFAWKVAFLTSVLLHNETMISLNCSNFSDTGHGEQEQREGEKKRENQPMNEHSFLCTELGLNAYVKPKQTRFHMLKCIMRFCIRIVLPHQLCSKWMWIGKRFRYCGCLLMIFTRHRIRFPCLFGHFFSPYNGQFIIEILHSDWKRWRIIRLFFFFFSVLNKHFVRIGLFFIMLFQFRFFIVLLRGNGFLCVRVYVWTFECYLLMVFWPKLKR